MHIYIYIYFHSHTLICTHVYMHTHTDIYRSMYMYMYMYRGRSCSSQKCRRRHSICCINNRKITSQVQILCFGSLSQWQFLFHDARPTQRCRGACGGICAIYKCRSSSSGFLWNNDRIVGTYGSMFNGRRRAVSRVRISAQCKQERELQEHDSPGVIAHLYCMHVGQPCLSLHVSGFFNSYVRGCRWAARNMWCAPWMNT